MRPTTLKDTPQKLMDVEVEEHHVSDCSEHPTPPPWSLMRTGLGSSTPTNSSNAESHGVKRPRVMFADLEPLEERPPKRLRFVSPCN
jgi:hypothetical protein